MSERPQETLARHLPPDVSEARLSRQWARVARPPRATKRLLGLGFALAAALATVLVVVAWRRHGAPSPTASLEGVAFEARAGGETVAMPDGTQAVLEPESRITIAIARPNEVRVAVDRGGVALDVAHVEGRRFVVAAAGHEVVVVGTRFHVRVGSTPSEPALEVGVDRGRVRVQRIGATDDARELGAGEAWSFAPPRTGHDAGDEAPAPGAAPSDAPPARSAASVPRADGAREVLARAEAAQAAGRPREAAAAFDELRRKYRADPRAGLAAFELGRLRLDVLGDPAGAAEAFVDAIALSPSAPLREDAEARRVEAYDRMGSVDRCREAKAAYLRRYPQGIHRAELARRCP